MSTIQGMLRDAEMPSATSVLKTGQDSDLVISSGCISRTTSSDIDIVLSALSRAFR